MNKTLIVLLILIIGMNATKDFGSGHKEQVLAALRNQHRLTHDAEGTKPEGTDSSSAGADGYDPSTLSNDPTNVSTKDVGTAPPVGKTDPPVTEGSTDGTGGGSNDVGTDGGDSNGGNDSHEDPLSGSDDGGSEPEPGACGSFTCGESGQGPCDPCPDPLDPSGSAPPTEVPGTEVPATDPPATAATAGGSQNEDEPNPCDGGEGTEAFRAKIDSDDPEQADKVGTALHHLGLSTDQIMEGVTQLCGVAADEDFGSEEDRAGIIGAVKKTMEKFAEEMDKFENHDDGVVIPFGEAPIEAQCSFLKGVEEGFAIGVSDHSSLDPEEAEALFFTMFGHVAEEDILGEGNSCPEDVAVENDDNPDAYLSSVEGMTAMAMSAPPTKDDGTTDADAPATPALFLKNNL